MNNQTNNKKFLRGYVAAVLTDDSMTKLKKLAIYPDVYCHHVTLAYKPSIDALVKFSSLTGKQIKLKTIGIASDDKAQVALISGCSSENAIPHITISCQNGTAPNYSNELLKKATPQAIDIDLEAIVQIVRF